jgi:putative ABC transport system permease protein
MNVMIMAVYERVKEIGTMSAMGISAFKIRVLFIYEGLLLGIIGSVAGSIIGSICVYVIRVLKLTFSFGRTDNIILDPVISLTQIGTVSVIVIIIAIIAVLEPAIKASKLQPIDALRQ